MQVRECTYKGKNAMEMFRHIREVHLTEIKKLKIKIGGKPATDEAKRRMLTGKPGPRSRTKLKQNIFPFNIFGSATVKDEVKEEAAEIKTEIKTEEPEPMDQDEERRPSREGKDQNGGESEGVLCPNQAITLTLKSTGFRIRLSTEADDEPEDAHEDETGDDEATAEEVKGDEEGKEEEVSQEYVPEQEVVEGEEASMENSFVEEPSFDSTLENSAEEEAPIEVDPTKDWHVEDEEDPAEISLNTSDPYSIDEFDE